MNSNDYDCFQKKLDEQRLLSDREIDAIRVNYSSEKDFSRGEVTCIREKTIITPEVTTVEANVKI